MDPPMLLLPLAAAPTFHNAHDWQLLPAFNVRVTGSRAASQDRQPYIRWSSPAIETDR
jgi:hypothetical protein